MNILDKITLDNGSQYVIQEVTITEGTIIITGIEKTHFKHRINLIQQAKAKAWDVIRKNPPKGNDLGVKSAYDSIWEEAMYSVGIMKGSKNDI